MDRAHGHSVGHDRASSVRILLDVGRIEEFGAAKVANRTLGLVRSQNSTTKDRDRRLAAGVAAAGLAVVP
jgi:hypothetical protein